MDRRVLRVITWCVSVGLLAATAVASPSSAPRWMDVDGSDYPILATAQQGSEFWVAIGDGSVVRVMKWQGATLEPVGQSLICHGDVHMFSYQGSMFIGGDYMSDADTVGFWGIRRWNGTSWEPAFDSTQWRVFALINHVVWRDTLYLSGFINDKLSGEDFEVVRYDGYTMVGVPGVFGGKPEDFVTYQDKPYLSVIGSAGTQEINPRVYRLDDTGWVPVIGADGKTLEMNANSSSAGSHLEEYHGDLYVSGLFRISGSSKIISVAKWDGNVWTDVSQSLPTYQWGGIGSMATFNDRLVAAYSALERSLWQWDGTTWSRMAQFGSASAREVLIKDGELMVVGDFTSVDNAAITYAAVPNRCCQQSRGNVNGDPSDIVDLSDVSALIAFLTDGTIPPSSCPMESDVNGSLQIDLTDLSILIAYMTLSVGRPSLSVCP